MTTFEERLTALVEDQTALKALMAHGVTSLDSLLAIVRDQMLPPSVRVTACWVAGQLKEKRAVGALVAAFRDPNPDVSHQAAHALVLLGSRRAVSPLIAALEGDTNVERREAAAHALGHLDDPRAVAPLLRVLTNRAEDARLRGQAAESLGYLMDARAVEPLIAMLRDPAPEVRFWSAFAHGWLRDRRALPELRRLAAEDTTQVAERGSISKEATEAIADVERGWGTV